MRTALAASASAAASRRALVASLLAASSLGSTALSCRRPAPSGAAQSPPASNSGDAGFRHRVPAVLPVPGTPAPDRRSIDVPLSWLFLPESPAVTGAAPNVLVGAVLPCGYSPDYGDVSPPESPLRVRLRARWDGPGAPDPNRECAAHPRVAVYISLQRLRLGEYEVTDATPHGPTDPPVPSVRLRVVEDSPTTPASDVRCVRRCTPDDDATCAAGGACGALPDRAGVGVCAPPLDPYLLAGRPCPSGTTEVRLTRTRPFAQQPAPALTEFRACLPACDAAHPCHAPLACSNASGAGVCAPE